jgi:hypothetical protein
LRHTSETIVLYTDSLSNVVYTCVGPYRTELATTTAEVTNVELSRMVYWLMVVGYSLRTMEAKFEMENTLLPSPGGPAGGLPPGA